MPRRHFAVRCAVVSLAITVLATCSGGSTNPIEEALTIIAHAGNNQTGTAGDPLATDPAVKVTTSNGQGAAGKTVTFAVASGGGGVQGAQQTTDANGVATVGAFTLGNTAGANTLTATVTGNNVTGNPVTFSATGNAGPAAAVVKQAGDAQTAVAGQPVAVRSAVRVTDRNGNPVSGVVVTFAVATGGGSITGATSTTDATGTAAVGSWTLGTTAGPNSLTAAATGTGLTGNPSTFTATGTAGAPAAMVKTAGDAQTATVNTSVPIAPAVRVNDLNGNPVAGVSVTFAIGSGGGSVTGASATTGPNGVATVGGWTLGTAAGAKSLTATATGAGIAGNPATFTATATAGPPGILTKNAGDTQTAPANSTLPVAAAVRVTDANQNPVAGVTVTFAVASGGGIITGAAPVTDVNGIATIGSWRLGPAAGANSLTAAATGAGITGNPATFTATGTALVAATMTKTAGDAQTAVTGTAVPVQPEVRVTSTEGVPMPNVAVDFTVTGGGGTSPLREGLLANGGAASSMVVVQTDLDGRARSPWTMGTVGAQALRAQIAAPNVTGNPATFTATSAYNVASFAGNWAGNWNNIDAGSNGSATMTVTVNTQTQAISITLDLNGNVFGMGNPPPETFNGTYSTAGGFTVSGPSVLFGLFNLTVGPTGTVTGSGINPAAGISRIDIAGTATPTSINLTITIRFVGGTIFTSTLTLTK